MWVDIFPRNPEADMQPPVSIEKRTPKTYQLRVIIWNTKVRYAGCQCVFSLPAWLISLLPELLSFPLH